MNCCCRSSARGRTGSLSAAIIPLFCKGGEGKGADFLWRSNVKGEVGYPEMLDCYREAFQDFQLSWSKGTNQGTSAPHRIIEPTTNPAQRTRTGFYLSNENPAGEKFIVCKDTAEGLLVLRSCCPIQTLTHVFTTTFPLIFRSLASRARAQLGSSLRRLCQQRNPLTLTLCSFLPGWRMLGHSVAQVSDAAGCQVSAIFSGIDKRAN